MKSPRQDPDAEGRASEELLPIVYNELRILASARLRNEIGNQTLQPTALVHEAWLRLTVGGDAKWRNEGHFFGAASQAMRRILVERARARATTKRLAPPGSDILDQQDFENDDHIVMIHECLTLLEKSDPDSAKVVLLKFYGGLDTQEIARITGRGVRSVERHWMLAKARLYQLILAQNQAAEEPGA